MEGYHRYLSLRAERSLSDEMTSEMLSVFATHSMLGSPEALRYTEQLCAQVAALPEGRRGKRILWLHTLPHWQDSLRALLNFRPDVEIVGCDMALDADVLPEPERPYESMARTGRCTSATGAASRPPARPSSSNAGWRPPGSPPWCWMGMAATAAT